MQEGASGQTGWARAKQIAERLGCDPRTVWRWLKGERRPSARYRRALAELTSFGEEALIEEGVRQVEASTTTKVIEAITEAIRRQHFADLTPPLPLRFMREPSRVEWVSTNLTANAPEVYRHLLAEHSVAAFGLVHRLNHWALAADLPEDARWVLVLGHTTDQPCWPVMYRLVRYLGRWSRADLGRQLGRHANTIIRVELNQNEPSADARGRLLDLYRGLVTGHYRPGPAGRARRAYGTGLL
jgi:transcriptional regulator with XRE-family HTH domain